MSLQRPHPDECAPYYHAYIGRVGDGDVLGLLREQMQRIADVLGGIAPERETHRYASGKWSIRELVLHCIDTERVLSFRALCLARGERQPLPGFDEDAYAAASGADARTLPDLLTEWHAVRDSTIHLLAGLPEEAGARRGTASGQPTSVRALAYIIHGHAEHHLQVLAERYY